MIETTTKHYRVMLLNTTVNTNICFATHWSSTPTQHYQASPMIKRGSSWASYTLQQPHWTVSTYLPIPGHPLSCRDGNSRFLVPQMHWRNFTALPLCSSPQFHVMVWKPFEVLIQYSLAVWKAQVDGLRTCRHSSCDRIYTHPQCSTLQLTRAVVYTCTSSVCSVNKLQSNVTANCDLIMRNFL